MMTPSPAIRTISAWTKSVPLMLALAAIGAALAVPVAVHAADDATTTVATAAPRHKVVFQVSDADPQKWNLALNNAKNVQEALGKDKVAIELVAYGPGIAMLRMESEVGNRVADAVAQGVKIVACEATMHAQKLTKDDMLNSAGYVPAGVVELMKRQSEGYAYIRP